MSSYDGDENPIFSDGWFRRSDGNTIYQNVVERCVGTGRCCVCQGRGYFVAISVFMALYPPARKYSDGSRIWRGMLDNVPCVNVGNTDGSCSRQLQSYD